jgi:hypothetical protein
MVAASIERAACNENVGATVRAVAPAAVALVALTTTTPATEKRGPLSNTERSHKRRAGLRKLGLSAKHPGSLDAARLQAERGCNGDFVGPVAPSVAPVAPSSTLFS